MSQGVFTCGNRRRWRQTLWSQFARRSVGLVLVLVSSVSFSPAFGEKTAAGRSWKALAELSEAELIRLDLASAAPRDPEYPYLPAEPYPFSPPYSAEEMGIRAMEFTQRPRWSCVFANIFGSISQTGFLSITGQGVGYMAYPSPRGLEAEIRRKPGQLLYRYLTQHLYPPEAYGSMNLVFRYRTGPQFVKKEDMFFYSPSLRRVRRQKSQRRSEPFPQMAVTFDDASGRAAWEFSWRLLGTDVLYETVRFPTTRPQVLVTQLDGTFREVATQDIRLMGAAYPLYTPGGGVECYVVEARAKADWIPDYARPRLLYWLEKRAFYPLRTEMYDRAGQLVQIEVRRTKLVNPELGDRGYAPFIHLYWDIAADILTYNIRDGIRPMDWSEADTLTYFSPDFMRRQWYLEPVRSYLGVERPEEFFLRPQLELGKFPEQRQISLPPELMERLRAQDAAGRLIFNGQTAARHASP